MARAEYGYQIPARVEILTKENAGLGWYFFCGNDAIDHYYQCEALDDASAVTYLVIDDERNRLLAAMTISCSAIFLAKKMQLSTLLSAMEVVYFAVHLDYQGLPYRPGDPNSLSYYLFNYMIEQMRRISREHVGAAKIVLYSVPEAENFYKKIGFKRFGGSMYGDRGTFVRDCVPMFFDLN